MNQKPQFSVLLSFHNQRDEVEPSLTALYELDSIPCEIIIIDDASTDGTAQAIHSLLDYYSHEHTFFFEHTRPAGRGNSLNEALQQAGTSIIWAPRSFGKIDEQSLQKAIKYLKNNNASCLTQNLSFPTDFAKRANIVYSGALPRDAQMLWNRAAIPARQQFFDPFLEHYHATELWLRLGMDAIEEDQTFYTPSDFEQTTEPTAADRQELLMALLRRPQMSSAHRQILADLLLKLPPIAASEQQTGKTTHDLLERAVKLKLDGQLSAALECVERVLSEEPANPEAKNLKIKLLERKRRFVEASELKHEMEADSRAKTARPGERQNAAKTTLIIPTALYGKPALEHCLVSVDQHCNPATTQLIIIDNASLDDTHEYLEELKEKEFFNCRVITNKKNKGFAASVNQGLQAADAKYACVLHNDIELRSPAITMLEQRMDDHPEYALLGPLTDSTLNPDQLTSNKEMYEQPVVPADYLDSFCMMIRTEAGLRMDEEYTLAFFDDIDLCFQARDQGLEVGIAPEVELLHHYGTTTFALDLDTESELYWKNIAYFNEKWKVETFSQEDLQSKGRFEQLLMLDQWVNPLFPEPVIKEKFAELFTDEVKTEILKSTHDRETLLRLIHLLMVMGKREVMRRLEDRTEDMELPAGLIYELVRFYFNRNVYSRCLYYLNRLTGRQESLQSDLYRLAILIDEKKMKEAIPKLTALLDRAPSNPLLYKLAGDIHAFKNNSEEAQSFYSLANQINPFDFTETQQEIKLNS